MFWPLNSRSSVVGKLSMSPRTVSSTLVAPSPKREVARPKTFIAIQLTHQPSRSADEPGFTLRQAENEYAPRKGAPLPFVQQLEFRPGGRYAGRLEELELIFKLHSDDALDVLVELDRRAGGLGGLLESALEMNERVSRLPVTRSDVERGAVEGMLAQLIDGHIR